MISKKKNIILICIVIAALILGLGLIINKDVLESYFSKISGSGGSLVAQVRNAPSKKQEVYFISRWQRLGELTVDSCTGKPYLSTSYKNPFNEEATVTFKGEVKDEFIFNGKIIDKGIFPWSKCNGGHFVSYSDKVKKDQSVTIAVGDNHGSFVRIQGTLTFTLPPKCVVIAVNGINSAGEFSSAVKSKASDIKAENFYAMGSGLAKSDGQNVKKKILEINKQNPKAKILVAAHSLGAIGVFNYANNMKNVSYLLYDPPYNVPNLPPKPLGFLSFIYSGISNGQEIRIAKSKGIAGSAIDWSGGLDGKPTKEEDAVAHMRFQQDPSVLNGVSSWVTNCLKETK